LLVTTPTWTFFIDYIALCDVLRKKGEVIDGRLSVRHTLLMLAVAWTRLLLRLFQPGLISK